jgi:hypothetical protein
MFHHLLLWHRMSPYASCLLHRDEREPWIRKKVFHYSLVSHNAHFLTAPRLSPSTPSAPAWTSTNGRMPARQLNHPSIAEICLKSIHKHHPLFFFSSCNKATSEHPVPPTSRILSKLRTVYVAIPKFVCWTVCFRSSLVAG